LAPRPGVADTGDSDTAGADEASVLARPPSPPAPPPPAPRVEPPREWFIPAGEIFLANMGLWAYNRYYKQYGFAHISPSTMWDNLTGGWVWDEDQFSINQFGHPYQGS